MDIPNFEEVFKQIYTNFWLIGLPFDQSNIKFRYFVFLFNILIAIVEETGYFVSNFSAENFLDLTQLAPCTCIGVLSFLKIIFIAIKKKKTIDLIEHLKELYNNALKDKRKREIIKQDFIFLKYLVKYFFILNAILICVYNFSSLVLIAYQYYAKGVITYILPYAMCLPFSTDYWYTWLVVYIHSLISGFVCVIYFATADALYYIMTSHICAQFSLLSDEIRELHQDTSYRLKGIIKKHQYILKVSQKLEDIFRGLNLFNVLIGSVEICALGFNLTMGQWTQVPGVVLFLLSVLLQILMISIFGENLIRESSKIGESAYLCKWYDMDQMSKKIILLLMLRSNKPQKLTAYKFSIISYESFTRIISTSWSYFTILKTMYTPP